MEYLHLKYKMLFMAIKYNCTLRDCQKREYTWAHAGMNKSYTLNYGLLPKFL